MRSGTYGGVVGLVEVAVVAGGVGAARREVWMVVARNKG